jgi:hypothetical protein
VLETYEDLQYSKDASSVEATLRDLKDYLRDQGPIWTNNKILRWSYNKITGSLLVGASYLITHGDLETPDDPPTDVLEWWKIAPYRNKDWIRGEAHIPTRTYFVNNCTTSATKETVNPYPRLVSYFRGFSPTYDKVRCEKLERFESEPR